MEKDSERHYRAYESLKAANNGNTSSLKRGVETSKSSITGGLHQQQQQQNGQIRCLCFGGVPDKASHHSFLKGFVINLGICALLVAYTLLGSFIFLAIEGGSDVLQQRILATTIASGNQPSKRNATAWLDKVSTRRIRRAVFINHPFVSTVVHHPYALTLLLHYAWNSILETQKLFCSFNTI